MEFDISLSLTLFSITLVIIALYTRCEGKIRPLFGGRRLGLRDAVLLVAAMGITVTILAFIPKLDLIKIFFVSIYTIILFLSTYLIVSKWHLAILSSAFFVALYFLYWNVYLLNVFAILFAVFISIYLGILFTWKTTAVFTALLTIMDVVQVLGTKMMVISGQKMISLALPAMIIIPTFPSVGRIILGLGDIFLTGLIVIQTTKKYGRKFGFITAISIAAIFFTFETILLNFYAEYFPATIMVTCGWLTALGTRYAYTRSR